MIHALIVLALVSQQPNTAAPSRRLVVTGTVLDERNKPIEHAKVYLSKKSEDDGRERVVARGETDAEGRFRVETDYRFAVSDGAKSLPVSLWSVTPKNRLLARSLSNTGSLKSKEEILRYSKRCRISIHRTWTRSSTRRSDADGARDAKNRRRNTGDPTRDSRYACV